ncbi:MAG TPA: hypothetical protein VN903_06325 [Polyangia bacterium]|nr:hypothetical protein [Polyangia bacterium]
MIGLIGQRLKEHVGGLQVTVDDAFAVRECQPAQHLARDVKRPRRRHRPLLDQLKKSLSLEKLHDQVRHVIVDPRIGHRDDVRVREGGQGLRFPREASPPIGVGRRVLLEDLDRDESTELCVLGPVDEPDPAGPQAFYDFIASIQRAPDIWIGHRFGRKQITARGSTGRKPDVCYGGDAERAGRV